MSTSECAASVKPVERSRTRQQKGQSKRKETKERHGVGGLHQTESRAKKDSTARTGRVEMQTCGKGQEKRAQHARSRHDFGKDTSKHDEVN